MEALLLHLDTSWRYGEIFVDFEESFGLLTAVKKTDTQLETRIYRLYPTYFKYVSELHMTVKLLKCFKHYFVLFVEINTTLFFVCMFMKMRFQAVVINWCTYLSKVVRCVMQSEATSKQVK
jgi:hypothetical protein